jgi:hypothetical protein
VFGIPHTQQEIEWAHRRPEPHRTPLPVVGDEVMYRHQPWGPVVRAEVTWVQSLDDMSDPHLWQVQTDPTGNPVLLEGKHVLQRRFDPWPVVRLRVPGLGVGETREARLRGSAGWLPLDWEVRFRPEPEFVVVD